MQYLPDRLEQEWLLSRLRHLISRCGHDSFATAPIVVPTREFFPEPWDGTVAGVERITRRLLQYAGLGLLGVELSVYFGEVGSSAEDPAHPNRSTVGAFLGIRGGKCRFAINGRQSADPEQLAGVMAHEVAHAYRARHKLRQTDHQYQDEEELLTDLTTVYLGFGVLAVNNAHRYRSYGELYGSRAYTFYGTTKIGYLPAQALSFLLAVQLSARATEGESRHRLLRYLETDQAAYVKAALREIEEQGLDLASTLGLPPQETWGQPKRLEEILLPLPAVHAVAESDSEEPLPEKDHTFNAGRPVFRVTMPLRPFYMLLGGLVFGCMGGVFFRRLGDAAVFAFGVAGFVLGFVLDGRRRRQDICSDPGCGATLEPAVVQCPGCGGTISGRIKNPSERLEREEEISGTRRIRTRHRKRRRRSRK